MEKVLTSWKEIAAYFGKGVRTVQRWELQLGLPVRRPKDSNKNIVMALQTELSTWINDRTRTREYAPVLKKGE
jgi:hypothetical protein